MWTRKQLKEKANLRLKANYWLAVVAALILTIVVGGSATCTPGIGGSGSVKDIYNDFIDSDDFDYSTIIDDDSDLSIYNFDEEYHYNFKEDENLSDVINEIVDTCVDNKGIIIGIFAIMAFVFLIISVVSICLKVFVGCPLEVGAKKFFVDNLNSNAELKTVGKGFSVNYLNTVKIMFLRELFIRLWSLLFIIPGIIKGYEYRMIPYILADDPNTSYEEAFALSKKMMTGNKWDAFVLDLSFIGWHILNLFTCGILGVFYVNPYQYQTNAALYEVLRESSTTIDQSEEYIEVE